MLRKDEITSQPPERVMLRAGVFLAIAVPIGIAVAWVKLSS